MYRALTTQYRDMMENKMASIMLVMMVNNVANSMMATGAFEIRFGDEMVFSKLAAGRFPTGPEVADRLVQMGLKMA